MQIRHVILKVDEQDKALRFYTSKLGFKKHLDVSGNIRWLTVTSPEGAEGVEIVLEPNHFPPALASQRALYDAGFRAAILSTDDVAEAMSACLRMGVKFRGRPKSMGNVTFAFLEDTCGNLIVLSQRADT